MHIILATIPLKLTVVIGAKYGSSTVNSTKRWLTFKVFICLNWETLSFIIVDRHSHFFLGIIFAGFWCFCFTILFRSKSVSLSFWNLQVVSCLSCISKEDSLLADVEKRFNKSILLLFDLELPTPRPALPYLVLISSYVACKKTFLSFANCLRTVRQGSFVYVLYLVKHIREPFANVCESFMNVCERSAVFCKILCISGRMDVINSC